MALKYIDTHCHLQFRSYDKDRFEVIERMKKEEVAAIVVGTNAEDSAEAVELTTLWPEGLWAIVGMHPTEVGGNVDGNEMDKIHFHSLIHNDKVIGIGECGLDYFRTSEHQNEAPRKTTNYQRGKRYGVSKNYELRIKNVQKQVFEQQIGLALEHDLPLMLHIRASRGTMDAYEDALDILNSYFKIHASKLRGTSHFFAGSLDIAKQFLELGFMLSLAGPITFAREYDEVIKYAPLDMILSETDAPFAAPEPYRGRRNEPIYVQEVVKKIAEVRGEKYEKVRGQLMENASRVFGIKSSQAPEQSSPKDNELSTGQAVRDRQEL